MASRMLHCSRIPSVTVLHDRHQSCLEMATDTVHVDVRVCVNRLQGVGGHTAMYTTTMGRLWQRNKDFVDYVDQVCTAKWSEAPRVV